MGRRNVASVGQTIHRVARRLRRLRLSLARRRRAAGTLRQCRPLRHVGIGDAFGWLSRIVGRRGSGHRRSGIRVELWLPADPRSAAQPRSRARDSRMPATGIISCSIPARSTAATRASTMSSDWPSRSHSEASPSRLRFSRPEKARWRQANNRPPRSPVPPAEPRRRVHKVRDRLPGDCRRAHTRARRR